MSVHAASLRPAPDQAAPGLVRTRPTVVYNPLPRLLAHYEQALADTLAAAGVDELDRSSAAPVEMGDAGAASRLRKGARAVRAPGRLAADAHVIACWPSFGLLEPLLWRRVGTRARVSLVFHDPSPLRRHFGMGRRWARLGAAVVSSGVVDVVVHSRPAVEAVLDAGWPVPRLLPLPIRVAGAPPAHTRPGRPQVCVLGQWKPARDLRLLAELGPELSRRGASALIAGRAWPPVPGWEVRDQFLAEAELDDLVAASACVVIPYSRFFQSDIAARALEAGTPVVGPRHPFLEDLLGPAWPGLVDSDDPAAWADAALAMAAVAPATLAERRHTYTARCVEAWQEYVSDQDGRR